jgi:hypothetical protein
LWLIWPTLSYTVFLSSLYVYLIFCIASILQSTVICLTYMYVILFTLFSSAITCILEIEYIMGHWNNHNCRTFYFIFSTELDVGLCSCVLESSFQGHMLDLQQHLSQCCYMYLNLIQKVHFVLCLFLNILMWYLQGSNMMTLHKCRYYFFRIFSIFYRPWSLLFRLYTLRFSSKCLPINFSV